MTQQKVFFEDDKLVIKSRHDVNPILDRVRQLRDQNIDGLGENKLVGSIPMPLVAAWVKEAGLLWDDTQAVRDLIKRKIQSGEFSKFRVWEGKY